MGATVRLMQQLSKILLISIYPLCILLTWIGPSEIKIIIGIKESGLHIIDVIVGFIAPMACISFSGLIAEWLYDEGYLLDHPNGPDDTDERRENDRNLSISIGVIIAAIFCFSTVWNIF